MIPWSLYLGSSYIPIMPLLQGGGPPTACPLSRLAEGLVQWLVKRRGVLWTAAYVGSQDFLDGRVGSVPVTSP